MTSRTAVLAAAVLVAACAGGTGGPVSERAPDGTSSAAPTPTSQPGASLPASGVRARVVNLFADAAGPHDLDIYGFGGNDFESTEVLAGTVAYGAASDWFDPGFVEGSGGGRTSQVAVHLAGDPERVAVISSADAVAGAFVTVIVTPPDDVDARIQAALDHHPDTSRQDVPQAIADKGLLVTSQGGLPPASFADAVFHASVGESCLPGRFSDPTVEEIMGRPVPQPVGNELVVEPGSYKLTIHRDDAAPGEVADCENDPVVRVPLQIGAGERAYVFLYAEQGEQAIKALVVPLGG